MDHKLAASRATIYISFMINNWKLGKKELKRGINDIEDVPAFINRFIEDDGLPMHLKMEAEDFMRQSTQSFLSNHHCLRCKKYSLDKCSNCKIAHYCGQDCQEKDYERHSKECNSENLRKLETNRVVETILKERLRLEIEQEEKNFLKFDSFISSLDFKIFEACFSLLVIKKPIKPKNSNATSLESHWHFKGFNCLDTELRNEPVPFHTICEQSCEPNQSPTRDVKERKHCKSSRRRIHA